LNTHHALTQQDPHQFLSQLINSQFILFLPTHAPFSRENLLTKRKSAGAKPKFHSTLRSIFFVPSLLLFPFAFAIFFSFLYFFSLPFRTISYRATTPQCKIFYAFFFFFSIFTFSLSKTRFLSLLRLRNQITAFLEILSFRFSRAFSAEFSRRNPHSVPSVAR